MLVRPNDIVSKLTAAQYLADCQTEKKITLAYCGRLSGHTLGCYSGRMSSPHRTGCKWLLDTSIAHVADRAIRIFITMFGIEKINLILNASEFVALCKRYELLYPLDKSDMSTTRMHYLIDSIRKEEALIKEQCQCCGNPFIVHRDDAARRVCRICAH